MPAGPASLGYCKLRSCPIYGRLGSCSRALVVMRQRTWKQSCDRPWMRFTSGGLQTHGLPRTTSARSSQAHVTSTLDHCHFKKNIEQKYVILTINAIDYVMQGVSDACQAVRHPGSQAVRQPWRYPCSSDAQAATSTHSGKHGGALTFDKAQGEACCWADKPRRSRTSTCRGRDNVCCRNLASCKRAWPLHWPVACVQTHWLAMDS